MNISCHCLFLRLQAARTGITATEERKIPCGWWRLFILWIQSVKEEKNQAIVSYRRKLFFLALGNTNPKDSREPRKRLPPVERHAWQEKSYTHRKGKKGKKTLCVLTFS
jgi:hypothetical protein